MITIPISYCQCGCGQMTRIPSSRFIFGHQNRREFNPRWNGGKTTTVHGYVRLKVPSHPSADCNGYVYEHILIAEQALGHYLPDGAEIHHVDEDRANNKNTNLVICPSKAYHKLLHRRLRARRASGHADWLQCSFCNRYDSPIVLRVGTHIYHRDCRNAYRRQERANAKVHKDVASPQHVEQ